MHRILVITDDRSKAKIRKVGRLLAADGCNVRVLSIGGAKEQLREKWDGIVLLIDSISGAEKMFDILRTKGSANVETHIACEQLLVSKYRHTSVAYSNMRSNDYDQEEKEPIADAMKTFLSTLPKKENGKSS